MPVSNERLLPPLLRIKATHSLSHVTAGVMCAKQRLDVNHLTEGVPSGVDPYM